MTNATKHTPTPWKTDGYYIETTYETIASCGTSTLTVAEDHANADHIVKCVNMHDELVDAVIELMGEFDAVCRNNFSSDGQGTPSYDRLVETLKKAGAL